MIKDQNNLSVKLIIKKLQALTGNIYEATKELPCDQFATVISMLITMWCNRNGIDAVKLLDIIYTALDEEEDYSTNISNSL